MELNEVEKAFIVKEYETKHVLEMTGIRNAFFNAYTNANRKKGRKFNSLFNKRMKNAEKTANEQADIKSKILEIDNQDANKDWVSKLYQNLNMKGGKNG